MYTVQICGAVFGLAIAWGIQYYYEMRESRKDKEQRIKLDKELAAIRTQAKSHK